MPTAGFFVRPKKYAHTQEKAADETLTSTQGDKKGQKGINNRATLYNSESRPGT